MTELASLLYELSSGFSGNWLHALLLLNIVITTVLIFQNMRNYRHVRTLKKSDSPNDSFGRDGNTPPFPENTAIGSFQKPKTDIDRIRIDRAIKMVRDGYSDQDIKNSLEIEHAYLSILLQHYKPNKA
jgi:hypothetical protein